MLNEKQAQAFNIAEHGHNVLVTGEGGSGETFLIKEMAKALTENMITFQIRCSTGTACTLYPSFTFLGRDFGRQIFRITNN